MDECIHIIHPDACADNVTTILGWLQAHDDFEARAIGDEERRQFDRYYFLLNEAGKRDYELAAPAARADILDARCDWLRWRRDAPGDEKRYQLFHWHSSRNRV